MGVTPYALSKHQNKIYAHNKGPSFEESVESFVSHHSTNSQLQMSISRDMEQQSSITVEFKKIIIFPKALDGKGVGIWRPIPPRGFIIYH